MTTLRETRHRFFVQLLLTVAMGALCLTLSLATAGCFDLMFGGADDDAISNTNTGDDDTVVGAELCAPCLLAEDCGGSADLCLANFQTHERFCGQACGVASCPSGYECVTLGSDASGDMKQCVPAGDTCGLGPAACDPECDADADQDCYNGRCYSAGDYLAERALCLELVNAYRARLDLMPLVPDSELEGCARDAAEMDAQTEQAHGWFESTGGCDFLSDTELEIGGWSLERYGTVDAVVDSGIGTLWATGPGSEPYAALTAPRDALGCGVYVTSGGEVWLTLELN